MSTTPLGPPTPDGDPHPGPDGATPPPGTTRPDGSVWNGTFWEAPPGGHGAPTVEDLRAAGPAVPPGTRPTRSAVSDILGTTLGAVAMAAAAWAAAWLFVSYAPPSVAPGAQAAVSAFAGSVVGLITVGIHRLVVDGRSWYVSRARVFRAGIVLGLDLAQWLLTVLPAIVVTAAGAITSDRVLAMAGAACASVVGIALMAYAPSEYLTRRARRRDARAASLTLRWGRFWLMALIGGVAGLAHLLVPPPLGPVAAILVGSVVLAVLIALALPVARWWNMRPGPATRTTSR
ncbi:MAG: hypothetical protein ACTH0C_02935 [Actinomycetaceae bacterium]